MRKPASRRLKSIARLRALLRTSRRHLDAALARRSAAIGGEPADYGPLFDHLDAELAAAERHLAATEGAYHHDRFEAASLCQRRGEAASELYDHQRPTRRLLVQLVSEPALGSSTPRDARGLARQTRLTLQVLQRLEHRPPPVTGVEVHPRALAARLELRLGRLEDLCDALIAVRASTAASCEQADRALATADGTVSCVAGSLEGLCRLAGMDGLAGGIRRCAR